MEKTKPKISPKWKKKRLQLGVCAKASVGVGGKRRRKEKIAFQSMAEVERIQLTECHLSWTRKMYDCVHVHLHTHTHTHTQVWKHVRVQIKKKSHVGLKKPFKRKLVKSGLSFPASLLPQLVLVQDRKNRDKIDRPITTRWVEESWFGECCCQFSRNWCT